MSSTNQSMAAAASGQVPDLAGRFGDFGGRYVPETLIRALDELAVQYEQSHADTQFQAELGRFAAELRRPAVAAVSCRAAEPAMRRGADLSEARRPESHRRPQDQQHARPGAAHHADGQAARDRRDRRRPARRRHGHGLCPLRPGVRRLHGRGGHSPPEAQRVQHAAAGGRSAAGHQRLAHACATRSTKPCATG